MPEPRNRPRWLDEAPEKSSILVAASLARPHLGMRNEPGIYLSYPSAGNRCYRCRRPATPSLAHQDGYCLKGAQRDCVAFNQSPRLAFPTELRERWVAEGHVPPSTGWLLAILSALVLIGLAEWWFFPQVFTFPGRRPSPAAAAGSAPPHAPIAPTTGPAPTATPAQTNTRVPGTG